MYDGRYAPQHNISESWPGIQYHAKAERFGACWTTTKVSRRNAKVSKDHDSLRPVKDYYNSYGLLLQASNATKQRSLFITIRESIPQGGQQHILHLI